MGNVNQTGLSKRDRCALALGPLALRFMLALTFLWAGLGKFMAKDTVQGENAAILANMGVIKPPASTVGGRLFQPLPDVDPNLQGGRWPGAKLAGHQPDPIILAAAYVTMSDADQVRSPAPAPTPAQPEKPAEKPADAPKPEPTKPDPSKPEPTKPEPTKPESKPESKPEPEPTKPDPKPDPKPEPAPTPAPSPTRTPGQYTAADFPDPIEVQRLNSLAVLIHKSANPKPATEGTVSSPMRTWPAALAKGKWPVRLAYAVAITEIAAGVLVLLGLLTRLAALSLVGVMLGAIWLTGIGPAMQAGDAVLGFLPAKPRFDVREWMPLLWQFALLFASFTLALLGGGPASMDAAILGKPKEPEDHDGE